MPRRWPKATISPPCATLNKTLLGSYRKQDWDGATNALQAMGPLAARLGLDLHHYLLIYEARISEFIDRPPGSDWDGVYVATSK